MSTKASPNKTNNFAAAAIVFAIFGGLITASVLSHGQATNTAKVAAPAKIKLTAFTGCQDLLAWYREQASKYVTPYGWNAGGGNPEILNDGAVIMDLAAPNAINSMAGSAKRTTGYHSRGNSKTGTNVQEFGVDEPDYAKTDRKYIYRVQGKYLVTEKITGKQPVLVSKFELPARLRNSEILLSGRRIVAVKSNFGYHGYGIADLKMAPSQIGNSATNLAVINLEKPRQPKLVSQAQFSGRNLAVRQFGKTIRVVNQSSLPNFPFVQPDQGYTSDHARNYTPDEARELNRAIVARSKLRDWLPNFRFGGGKTRPLVECSKLLHPSTAAGILTTSVTSFNPMQPKNLVSTGITADANQVYATGKNLFVTTTEWPSYPGAQISDAPVSNFAPNFASNPFTRVHQFDLAGLNTNYAASGGTRGSLKDSWSLDADNGTLRMVVTRTRHNRNFSRLVMLRQDGQQLQPVGQSEVLGFQEDIKSVRWYGNQAVVVTFRETDPLYLLDLSDAKNPKVTGKLKIPGFSDYLHPVGDDLLLGVGYQVNNGRRTGIKVSLFSVQNPQRPRELSKTLVGDDSWINYNDPRGFTYVLKRKTAMFAYSNNSTNRKLVLLTKVSPKKITSHTQVLNRSPYSQTRFVPLGDGRVAAVSPRGIDMFR